MPRSEETEWWINAVYEAIKEIPEGRVTTYKHVAVLLGTPNRARQVGVCLSSLPTSTNAEQEGGESSTPQPYNLDNVPWQRVINSKGMISHRAPGWASRQAQFLEQEGVHVETDGMGEYYIDLDEYGWFPDRLPSEAVSDD